MFSLTCGIIYVTRGVGGEPGEKLLTSLYKAKLFGLTLHKTRFRSLLQQISSMALWRVLLLACLATSSSVALPAASVEPAASPSGNTQEARGLQQQSRNAIQTGDDLMDSIYSDCLRKDSVSCVKYKLFSFVDKVMGSKETFTLTDGVTVVKNAGSPPEISGEGAPRAIAEGDEEASKDFESMIVNRVERFLKTHTLKVDLKGNEVLNAVTSAGRALGDVADTLGLTEEDEDESENGRDVSEERRRKKSK